MWKDLVSDMAYGQFTNGRKTRAYRIQIRSFHLRRGREKFVPGPSSSARSWDGPQAAHRMKTTAVRQELHNQTAAANQKLARHSATERKIHGSWRSYVRDAPLYSQSRRSKVNFHRLEERECLRCGAHSKSERTILQVLVCGRTPLARGASRTSAPPEPQ